MKCYFIIFSMLFALQSFGQDKSQILKGTVTYITSNNVYVKFENTENIKLGSMLALSANNSPCLIVKNKSSSSCVCTVIGNCEVQKGDEVFFNYKIKSVEEKIEVEEKIVEVEEVTIESEEPLYKEKIKGRISVSSYHNIASQRDDRHRMMSRLSLSAQHINNSKFSFDTYLNYRQIFPSDTSVFLPRTTYFNVFNLALRYDVQPSFSVVFGRSINPKISSLGAIDGLQAEKNFGKSYVGAIAGFRPDILNFGFNSNLFQYGGYLGFSTQSPSFYSQTTVGFIEQKNSTKIDRRYLYFQHSGTISKKLSLFSSAELDVFRSINGVTTSQPRLTNLFLSANYRFNRKLNMMLSYDSRKRVLYYETFQTEIEKLLSEDIARQGLRIRVNMRPMKYANIGFSYSKRYQSDTDNKSNNVQGNFSISKIPKIDGRLAVTYNINASNYLQSNILSVRYSRGFLDQKLTADFYYRMVSYKYSNSESFLGQNYYGTRFSYNISRKLMVSASGEFSRFNLENNTRISLRVVQRFYGKNK